MSAGVFLFLYCYLQSVLTQGTGSGTDGNRKLFFLNSFKVE